MLPRILGLLILYFAVFTGLVVLQYTKKGNFTRRIGAMVISGQYSQSQTETVSQERPESTEKLLPVSGGISVIFGGLEFSLRNRDQADGFALVADENHREMALAESMELNSNSARFVLSDGTELVFESYSAGENSEIRINGIFAPGVLGLEIPIKPQRASLVRESDGGQISITHNGILYQFSRSVRIGEKNTLYLPAESPEISYRAVPERRTFSPADFIIANAGSAQFSSAYTQWNEENFSYWSRSVAEGTSEDAVVAFCAEALRRGSYRAAVAAIPAAFLNGTQRSYDSSVFIGGMDAALRSFVQSERDKISRISRMIIDKSPDFLRESHVLEFLIVRGYINFAEDGLELIRSFDASALTPEICPGVFEGYLDIKTLRSYADNPFERLVEQACHVFSGGLRSSTENDQVLVFKGDTADIEYNLRLGKALLTWAETAGSNDWAALGRSLLLSVFSLRDNTGAVPSSVELSETGGFVDAGGSRLSAGKIYRTIGTGEYFPRAAGIGSGASGMWAWTAASSVSASQEGNVLDVSVSFPIGETHYVMIRGIRPFTKIQIYNIDYPTDPQFERYDSSGWIYSSQEQILVLKMKHRTTVEHIRVYY